MYQLIHRLWAKQTAAVVMHGRHALSTACPVHGIIPCDLIRSARQHVEMHAHAGESESPRAVATHRAPGHRHRAHRPAEQLCHDAQQSCTALDQSQGHYPEEVYICAIALCGWAG